MMLTTMTTTNTDTEPLTYVRLAKTVAELEQAKAIEVSNVKLSGFKYAANDDFIVNDIDFAKGDSFSAAMFGTYLHGEFTVAVAPSALLELRNVAAPFTKREMRKFKKLIRDHEGKRMLKDMAKVTWLVKPDPRLLRSLRRKANNTSVQIYTKPYPC